jgi:uncharacterized protein (TIGR03437 family)
VEKLAVVALLFGCVASAQTISTVKVGTSVEGPYFYVDGRQYTTTQIFLWPTGSKHTVQFLLSIDPDTGTILPFQLGRNATIRYGFTGWKTNGPSLIPTGSLEQVITADPSITSVIAEVIVQHKIRFEFFNATPGDGNCSGAPANPPPDGPRYGILYVDNVCVGGTTEIYLSEGVHSLNAFPFPGYVFDGWMINGQQSSPYLSSFTVMSSVAIIPRFMPGKRVRFSSNPTGLKIIVDGSVIQLPPGPPRDQLPQSNIDPFCSPDYSRLPQGPPLGVTPLCIGDFDFLPGSSHRIGAPQSQTDDAGLWWVFSGFSNGLRNNDVYVPDGLVATQDAITANFVPGIPATFLTSPQGLKLEIDGRQNWPNYSFIWGAGEKHRVTAPATQTDSRGRKYVFAGWSNEGPAEQEVTIPNDRVGITLVARYQILGQVRLTSTPAGLKLSVDGADCATPCVVDRSSGAQIQVRAPRSIPSSALARYDFDNWSDGQAADALSLTFTTDVQSLQANYHTSYLLIANSDPVGQATFRYTPESSGGFFAEGTRVTVTVVPKGGYRFRRWDGDIAGTFTTGYLSMSSPREIIARLDKVPYIAPAGIRNAAGDTPDGTIGPGSIAAIYGENLAETLEVGRVNPLAQTLAGVTVTVNDRLLPLLFVSPRQINAQIPSDLVDGVYTANVRSLGQPEVTAEFTVRRNSPGLFTLANQQGAPLALALHEDGTPVTPESPARRREVISLFGTGLGPYEQLVIDGFLVPAEALYRLVDPLSVVAGELLLTPQWAGAAPGYVGTAVVKVKIADEMPPASLLDLVVSVNGVESNRVQLPVE